MAVRRGVSPRASKPDATPADPFDKLDDPQKRALLLGYAECASITGAVAALHCARTMHYYWLKTDPAYVEAFQVAHKMAIAAHEDEASRRAMGWDETHYRPDGTPYTVRKYSDTMLIFASKPCCPRSIARRVAVMSVRT